MLANNALTTIDRVKSVLQIDTADTSKNDIIAMFINSASDFIESYTGRTFGIAPYTDKSTGAHPTIIIKNTPVQEVSMVRVDGQELQPTSYTTDFYLGTVLNPHGWPYGWSISPNAIPSVEIDYTAGFVLPKDDTPEAPRTLAYDLENVCIELATKSYMRMMNQVEGKKSESQGSWSVSYETNDLTPQQTLILNKYMRLV